MDLILNLTNNIIEILKILEKKNNLKYKLGNKDIIELSLNEDPLQKLKPYLKLDIYSNTAYSDNQQHYSPINDLLKPLNEFKEKISDISTAVNENKKIVEAGKNNLNDIKLHLEELNNIINLKEFREKISDISAALNKHIIEVENGINNINVIKLRLEELKKILEELKNIKNLSINLFAVLDKQGNIIYTIDDEADEDYEPKNGRPTIVDFDIIDSQIEKIIIEIKKLEQHSDTSSGGGSKKSKKLPKKEILGEMRCIYKIPGDKKEYLKHKGKLITVKEYKELMKAKPKKKEAKPKKVKKTKSKK